VSFSNAIKNVPSTFDALKSPKLEVDERFKTFIDIAQHPESNSSPATANGGAFQLTLQDVGYANEAGKVPDVRAALVKADQQIDTDIAKVK
jgi:multiple sugar transport system substrate-binding protein